MPSLCTDAVCQKSVPERREIFSAVVSFSSTSSTSKFFAIVEPLRGCFSGSVADGAMLSVKLRTPGVQCELGTRVGSEAAWEPDVRVRSERI